VGGASTTAGSLSSSAAAGPSAARRSESNRIDPSQLPRPDKPMLDVVYHTKSGSGRRNPPSSNSIYTTMDTGNAGPRFVRTTLVSTHTMDLLVCWVLRFYVCSIVFHTVSFFIIFCYRLISFFSFIKTTIAITTGRSAKYQGSAGQVRVAVHRTRYPVRSTRAWRGRRATSGSWPPAPALHPLQCLCQPFCAVGRQREYMGVQFVFHG
jgi:hypothetical protein